MKHLEDNIRVQLTRLNRQIDYINLSLDLSKLKQRQPQIDSKQTFELNQKIENLLILMKDANRKVLNFQQSSSKEEFQSAGTANVKLATISTPPLSYYRNVPPP